MAEVVDVHMRQSDAFAWYMEDDPLLRSTIVAVATLDRAPDRDRFMEAMERASRMIPAFRQKVVTPPMRLATPRWTYDPDFDLSWHVRRVEAPAPKTFDTVLQFARNTGMTGFDRARPLWEFTVVEGLEDARAAIVMKVHHSLTDGIGGMQLAMQIIDFDRQGTDRGPLPDAPEGEDVGAVDLIRDAIAYDWGRVYEAARHSAGAALPTAVAAARHPFQTASEVLRTVRSVARFARPVSETLSPVMTERRLAWHYEVLDIPFDRLKAAARAGDCTLNDAFMAGVLGGMRRYHEHHGAPADELRVTMPISLRKADDPAGGNRITLVRFQVPVTLTDPIARMQAIDSITKAWRNEPAIPLSNIVAGALNLLPTGYTGGMLKHVDFLASNVPGVPIPVFVAGAQLERYYAFGPTIGASVNITLISYCGVCCIGVNTDTGAVADHEVFLDCLREGFEEVTSLADDVPAAGRT